jgi:hypothetical protein
VLAAPGTLVATHGSIKSVTITGAGTYELFLSNVDVADGDDSAAPQYKTLLTDRNFSLQTGVPDYAGVIVAA